MSIFANPLNPHPAPEPSLTITYAPFFRHPTTYATLYSYGSSVESDKNGFSEL